MATPLKISVIIPAFGREQSLSRAIASVLHQIGIEQHSLELIVVDDFSPEPIVVDEEASIRVIRHSRNRGAAAARNTGVAAASGELVAFLDSDDVWLPNKLANQIARFDQLAETNAPSLLAVGTGYFDPDRRVGALRGRIPREANNLITFASGCWFCPGSALLMSKSCFDQIGLQDENMRRLEDLDWFIRFGAAGGQLYSTDSHDVVIHPSGIALFDEVMRAADQLEEKFGPNGNTPLPSSAWNRLAAYLALEKSVAHFGAGNYVTGAKEIAKSLLRHPRVRASLLAFWTETRDVPTDAQRTFDEMRAVAD